MLHIHTATVDTYPIRYAANDRPGVWVVSTHPLAGRPGHEVAIYHEPAVNPTDPGDTAGIYVEVVRHAGRGDYLAVCEAFGPNQYRRQKVAHYTAPTAEEAQQAATEWILHTARPWMQRERDRQVDRVEVVDDVGRVHTGSLWGATPEWLPEARVLLDRPAEYTGAVRSNGVAPMPWERVRRMDG